MIVAGTSGDVRRSPRMRYLTFRFAMKRFLGYFIQGLLLFIPFVNVVVGIMMTHELSLRFGKGGWFTVGLVLLPFIFYPILAFGDSKYKG